MIRVLVLALLGAAGPWCSAGRAQTPQESEELEKALSDAGPGPVEYLRAIEKHLARYPNSPRKEELERAAARAAIEANDTARIVLYGERVLARQPDDLQILERVGRALAAGDSRDSWERALKYALRYETLLRQMQKEGARPGMSAVDWQEQTDRGIGLALLYEARASGNLGRAREALALAARAFETCPTAQAAREVALWDERLGKIEDAVRALADAFTIPDPRTTDAERARDRGRMGELYRQAKGSEAGLGDLVLDAYDRNLALIRTRELRLRAADPNARLTDPMEFTLAGAAGGKLSMATLKGRVVVFDFWATWCGPCRVQHPLYEQVKERFRDNPDVVFLSIDTDEERDAVKPFLDEVKWAGPVYFEDGLTRALRIASIPTTVITDKRGQIYSRMEGFVPRRFVEMLTERIRDALAN